MPSKQEQTQLKWFLAMYKQGKYITLEQYTKCEKYAGRYGRKVPLQIYDTVSERQHPSEG